MIIFVTLTCPKFASMGDGESVYVEGREGGVEGLTFFPSV